jgi:3-isopropylmalate dehydrogenase
MGKPSDLRFRWTECLGQAMPRRRFGQKIVVGVLSGEGIGPEVIASAVDVLNAVATTTGLKFEFRHGGAIGREAEHIDGNPLSASVTEFCDEVFAAGGAILCGPGGGRFVYDLRRQFNLFFKISPIQTSCGCPVSQRFQGDTSGEVDILIVREGRGGCYQGVWDEQREANGTRVATQTIRYAEDEVERFLRAAARLAELRRGRLTVVWKESGVPSISALWRDVAEAATTNLNIECGFIDIDLMAYRLIQDASDFDVVAAPNLFGDVLADLGAVLLGSRGNSFSGNFDAKRSAVYQTNHGAAYDLAGRNVANPVGQILSTAMMLRESFGLAREATAIEQAIRSVWNSGYCTADLSVTGYRAVGTREMGSMIAQQVTHQLKSASSDG